MGESELPASTDTGESSGLTKSLSDQEADRSDPLRSAPQYNHSDSPRKDRPASQIGSQAGRQASIDAFRGIVMFLMLAEVLQLRQLSKFYPTSQWAEWLKFHTTHVAWAGCSLHDLIQPGFSFLVGVSLPFSLAARAANGKRFRAMAVHAAWRSIVLILLGIALRSLGQTTTNYFFVDTLTQIGLGYFLLFLLAHATRAMQILAVVLILVAYWGLFAAWPLPAPDFDLTQVGVPPDWPYLLDGFAAHWNKNTNPAFAFDRWFMNLFPRQTPYAYDGGGYCTLNFVPTLATMLLGVIAGGFLRDFRRRQPPADGRLMSVLLIGGAGLCFVGWGLGYAGICPVVKRIWTPAWVLYSGGICFVTLGILSFVCDQRRWQAWAWPLMVIGANSITAYVMSWTMERPIMAFLHRHLGERIFLVAGEAWEPVLFGSAVLLSMWLILLWLYRQRIFVRI